VISSGALTAFMAGLVFGLSLIVTIGAQNTFVLRQGALRQHVPTVVVICSLSDAILIAAGVAGVSAALTGRQWLLTAVRVLGAALLFAYGAFAARRALHQPTITDDARATRSSRAAVIGSCLAFTWLNPAVYLDTVVLLGSLANTRPGHQWWFGGGATLGSILWFAALAFGAGLLTPVLKRPGAWRILDVFVAVIMTATALRVLLAA
jgi:L-lysine exporter family protein LysE/ArgO